MVNVVTAPNKQRLVNVVTAPILSLHLPQLGDPTGTAATTATASAGSVGTTGDTEERHTWRGERTHTANTEPNTTPPTMLCA